MKPQEFVESASLGHWVCTDFEADANANPIQILEDTEELFASPSVEVALQISEGENGLLAGCVLRAPYPDYPSRFYYVENDVLRGVEVALIAVEPGRIRARLTGRATDVNILDGSVPETGVVLEAWFTRVGIWPAV